MQPEQTALAIVFLAALFLLGLAGMAAFRPRLAVRFLNGFASSALAHYSEISLRLIVGTAMVIAAPDMRFSNLFILFGWLIVATSIILLLVPWRWHQRFAQAVLPPLTKRVWLFAVLALPLSVTLLYATLV
ncbi:hypothetical protein [Rheinheimera nanhaiensis]|uniref:Uncharacterized protein n=1 Tax=Rheinheimera nanhaiensis E407-8 TaxID=562729 RepID=I1DXK8_9GAMM|nr:hypothetical protein [Rheinheimera nanhaiensis]GAB58786.1 hypothetical protein RNAN_1774 [Rheinheimera nanhaiensis E407-8]